MIFPILKYIRLIKRKVKVTLKYLPFSKLSIEYSLNIALVYDSRDTS